MRLENGSLYKSALALLLEGKASEAISVLKNMKPGEVQPQIRDAAIGCAFAILGNREEAQSYLAITGQAPPNKISQALSEIGFAYLASHDGNHDDAAGRFQRARALDPSNPLPYYSLGLYYMWKRGDYVEAQKMIDEGLNLAPENQGLHLINTGLAAENGEYREALLRLRHARNMDDGLSRRAAAYLTLLLGSSPLNGGIIALVVGLLSMLPIIGPIVVLVWIAFSIISFIRLRRISPRLAVLPATFLIVVLGIFALHSGLTGTIWP